MSADSGSGLSRRQVIAAGTTGLITATATGRPARATARGRLDAADGTPEQVHLTWDGDPARGIVVSWVSPGQASKPRVRIGQRVIPAAERSCTDALSGTVTWAYHARVDGLRPGATYGYAVTADNDSNAADPFSATFTTAPEGRAAFRFTSFGDLATLDPAWAGPHGEAACAVGAVEAFQPLFHLLNGELTPGARSPVDAAQVWRDFGNNVQASAANRPWLPVPGSHEVAPGTGTHGLASFLARYTLPPNGVDGLEGRWYAFRVAAVLFVCLSGDDVAYSGASAGYSGGAQTRWLESTLAAARTDASVDWIVVQVHQCACSSAPDGNGSDLGVRQEWLPLFDTYEVDLVLSGHDPGYERSFPVRGVDPWAGIDAGTGAAADTRRPRTVTTVDSGVFDTSQGTVHLVLGGGARRPAASGPVSPPWERMARIITRPPLAAAEPLGPGSHPLPAAGAVEAATWSARRDPSAGCGIAVFDVNPGCDAGGQTSVTVRYYHAVGVDPESPAPGAPPGDYTQFETFTLIRPRSDGRRWHPRA